MLQRYLLRRGRKGDLHEVWGMEILTDSIFLGNPLLEWIQALGYFAGSIIVARVVYALFKGVFKRLASKTATKWDDVLVDQVEQYVPAENTYDVVVCATSSVEETMGPSDIRFVPNPAETSVRLTGLSGGESWTLTVRTLLGQEVLAAGGVGREIIDLSGLSTGTYVGEVQTDNGTTTSLRLVVR